MAKNSVRDFDATAANNTDIQSVDIAENCAPSGINNAIRELMADIKNVSTGTIALESPSADSLNVTGDLTVDTNTLYVDSANNRVGIGTSSPDATLQVGSLNTTGSNRGAVSIKTEASDATIGESAIYIEEQSGAEGYYIGVESSGGLFFSNSGQTTPTLFLDDSNNVLVGHTGSIFNNINATSTVGSSYSSNGEIFACSDQSSGVMFLNRKSTDGAIASFRVGGTTVGSISSSSNRLQIQSGSGGDLILGTGSNADAYRLSDAVIYPSVGDATVDLGLSNRRFKDLYLGGGVYLGGTASANKLDDYEEGTFTPTISNHSGTAGTTVGRYTIIGRLFTFQGVFTATSGTISAKSQLGGFPFAAASTFGHISMNTSSSAVIQMSACRIVSGASSFDIKQFDGDDVASGTGTINICFSGAFII